MKNQRLAIILVTANVLVLLCLAAQSKSESSQNVSSVVRTRMLELVDERGTVRASLKVETNGEAVFRLKDAQGTIRVKLGASEDGSGLLLLDNSTNPGMHVLAKRDRTTMTLINKGRKRVIEP